MSILLLSIYIFRLSLNNPLSLCIVCVVCCVCTAGGGVQVGGADHVLAAAGGWTYFRTFARRFFALVNLRISLADGIGDPTKRATVGTLNAVLQFPQYIAPLLNSKAIHKAYDLPRSCTLTTDAVRRDIGIGNSNDVVAIVAQCQADLAITTSLQVDYCH